jgi:DNA-binding winged helix-turn-helix (wHTH) protein/tetratricopeptide (TPR) repeat protein
VADRGGGLSINGARLDLAAGTLSRDGAVIPLRARSFALLGHLARHRGQVLSKSALLDAIWPDVTVTEDSLTQAIRDIRVAIGDDAGQVLQTVRGRGYILAPPDRTAAAAAAAPAPITRTIRVAVLPFADTAVPAELRPLVSALADDIAGALARFRSLTVLARGSAEAAAADSSDPQAIAVRLGADFLVQGTARGGGAALALRLSLVGGDDGSLRWSDSFDCSGELLLGVEAAVVPRLVAHIATGIEHEVEDQAARQPPASLTAYGHLARGRAALRPASRDEMEAARRHLLAATEADPGLSEAWAQLAFAEMMLNDYRMAPPEVIDRAMGHVRRAVALGPSESVSVSMLGYMQILTDEFVAAEANISRALKLNPSSVDAMMDMATLQLTRGRAAEALAWLDRARDVNPLRIQHHVIGHLAEAHYMMQRYDEAVQVLAELHPIPTRRRLWIAAALAKAGRAAEAAPHLAAFAAEMPGKDPLEVARHSYNYEHAADTEHLLDGIRLALAAAGR